MDSEGLAVRIASNKGEIKVQYRRNPKVASCPPDGWPRLGSLAGDGLVRGAIVSLNPLKIWATAAQSPQPHPSQKILLQAGSNRPRQRSGY